MIGISSSRVFSFFQLFIPLSIVFYPVFVLFLYCSDFPVSLLRFQLLLLPLSHPTPFSSLSLFYFRLFFFPCLLCLYILPPARKAGCWFYLSERGGEGKIVFYFCYSYGFDWGKWGNSGCVSVSVLHVERMEFFQGWMRKKREEIFWGNRIANFLLFALDVEMRLLRTSLCARGQLSFFLLPLPTSQHYQPFDVLFCCGFTI